MGELMVIRRTDLIPPRARQVKGMEAYETQSVGGLLCGGSDMGERPTQGARQQRCMRSHACGDVTARRDGNHSSGDEKQ